MQPAIYPLRPGRPRIYRRAPGCWDVECDCATHSRTALATTIYRNQPSQPEALQTALRHIDFWHQREPVDVGEWLVDLCRGAAG